MNITYSLVIIMLIIYILTKEAAISMQKSPVLKQTRLGKERRYLW